MIRPVDITNAGEMAFKFGALYYFLAVADLVVWLRFLIVSGILLSLTGTVIWAVEAPGRVAAANKKVRSLQAFCQDVHITHILKAKNGEGASWKDFGRPKRVLVEQLNFDLALKESGIRRVVP